MPSHFTLRMQFGYEQDPAVVGDQLLELVKVAPVDEIMLFFFGEELNNGHDTMEEIVRWIERSRPYRRRLAEAGVAWSLNPWHSVLHCDRGRALKPGQDWQRMVDPAGLECTAVVCPLDRAWQAYYEETLRLYAAEAFRVIWIDDDIRYHNHGRGEWGGCFCPMHVAEFNRRAGTSVCREEIVAACTAAGTPHPWRALWLDMWEDKHLEMIGRWRDIVEAGGSRLGLMSSSMAAHAAEGRRWGDWWRALAVKMPPVHRPHFWSYGDTMGSTLWAGIAALDHNRSVQPVRVESGPEIENFPYGRWNKSFRQTAAQMRLAHVLGSTTLNISLYDFMGNRPDDEPQRAAFLKRERPVCDWLADQFPMGLRSHGVGLPYSEDAGRKVRTKAAGGWASLKVPMTGWAQWLAAAGHAFSVGKAPQVNALSGGTAWSLSDEALDALLSHGLLLDGPAACILVERGFGARIGLRSGAMQDRDELVCAMECPANSAFALHEGARISVNSRPHAKQMFQGNPLPGVGVESALCGPRGEVVGHGLLTFANDQGGRVAIVPWVADEVAMMDMHRAAQLTRVLGYLDPEGHHGWVEGGAWLVPQFLTDGRTWRGVVWNGSPDAATEVVLHLPAGMPAPAEATHLSADAQMIPVTRSGARLLLQAPLYEWECIVLHGATVLTGKHADAVR